MSFLPGKNAAVTISSTTYKFRKWTLNMKGDILDNTNFDSSGYRENTAGLVGAEITLSGPYFSGGMPFTVGTSYSIVLGAGGGITYTVAARCASIDNEADVEGLVTVAVNFVSTGSFTAAIT